MGSIPKDAIFITLAAAAGIGAAVAYTTVTSGPAETPAAMTEVAGLDEAMTRATAADRPVVAVVTADWCPPCQKLKRETLSDERVAGWFEQNAVAVSLVDGANDADIAKLPMRAFPTTFVIRGGEVAGTLEGYASTDAYLAFLTDAVGG